MRRTQRTALPMFEERGFDAVTVTEIADAVGMAASTLYRHFVTKEAIVLWDEHDVGLEEAFVRELATKPPFAAMRTVLVDELGGRYDQDLAFQLRRVQYIHRTDALHAASVEADYADTLVLAEALRGALSDTNRDAAIVLAGAAMIALDVAFDRWQAADATIALGTLIDQTFETLANLEALR